MKQTDIFGQAKWVCAATNVCAPIFRKKFKCGKVKKAEIVIAGLGSFKLYINGKEIGDELFLPLHTDYFEWKTKDNVDFNEQLSHRIYVKKYDVSKYLVNGENVIGVWLAPGWYADVYWPGEKKIIDYGDLKLCFNLSVEDDGSLFYVHSDEKMLTDESVIVEYVFTQGETHDYSAQKEDWSDVFYDDSGWKKVKISKDVDTEYLFSDCPHDKEIRTIIPKLIKKTHNSRIYDAGENMTGYPVIETKDGLENEITIRVSEEVLSDGELDEMHSYSQIMKYKVDGKRRIIKPLFTWLAFRYFEVIGECEVLNCTVVHADVKVSARFESDNEKLNWLFNAYIRTQLCNMHRGIPSDCPHEERRGYTGDGQLTAESAMLMIDSCEFYRKWIEDISDCQDKRTGHVQYTAPYRHAGGGPGGWGCAIVEVPYLFYKQFGDIKPAEKLFNQMLHYFDFLKAHSENNLVISDVEGEWCLGDWCTPEDVAIPEAFVNSYFFVKSLSRAILLAKALKKKETTIELTKQRKIVCRAIHSKYFDEKTGDYAENVQGANAFAVDIGLGDERTKKNLIEKYRKSNQYDTGIFGTEIVTRVLFEIGEDETAFKLLTSEEKYSFGNMRKNGATTLWEYWTGERSHFHPMFGAVTKLLFYYILGIRQAKESFGYEKIIISPSEISLLNFVSGEILTPRGKIEAEYKKTGEKIKFNVTIPENIECNFVFKDIKLHLTPGNNEIEVLV